MKQPFITFFVVLFLFSTGAYAQSWCPPGATWIYNSNGAWLEGQTRYTYAGDTVVDGFAGQRLERRNLVIPPPWAGDTMYVYNGPALVTRTQPGMVFWWIPEAQEWDTLYWFSALPGDRWTPGWEQQPENCADGTYLMVLDTGATVVDAISLRTLTVARYIDGDAVGDSPFTIMERVGNADGYIVPVPPAVCIVDEVGNTLGCYSDDEIGYPTSGSPCELTLAVAEINAIDPASWSVSPVPFQDHFTVRSAMPRNATVILLDRTGRELLSMPFHGTALEVDPGQLPAGSYVLRMVDARGTLGHRMVIKE